MSRVKILLPALLIVTIFSTSCLKHRIEGSYYVRTEDRVSVPFTQLSSEGDFDVYYSYSPNYLVSVEAEDNLIPFIETEVHGNDLVIKTERNRCFENHFPIKVYVQSPYINEVVLSGSGSINIDSTSTTGFNMVLSGSGSIDAEIYTSSFESRVSGSGSIYLTGYAHQGEMKISGSGDIDAYGFEQGDCSADISGSGNMKIFVTDVLNAHISGSGRIYYKGNPVVNTTISGSGRVIHQ